MALRLFRESKEESWGCPPNPREDEPVLEGILQHMGERQLGSCRMCLLNVQTGRHPKDASNSDENG